MNWEDEMEDRKKSEGGVRRMYWKMRWRIGEKGREEWTG